MLDTNAKINDHHKNLMLNAASGPAGLIEVRPLHWPPHMWSLTSVLQGAPHVVTTVVCG